MKYVIDYFKDTNPYIFEQEKSYAKWFFYEIGIYSAPTIDYYRQEIDKYREETDCYKQEIYK